MLPFNRTNTAVVLLSMERFPARRARFNESLEANGGFLNQLAVEWFKGTPWEECFVPPSFKRLQTVNHWWAATCDHLRIMETALANPALEYLFIFEDDATFHENFESVFRKAWESLPVDWRGLRLGWNSRFPADEEIVAGSLHRCPIKGQKMHAMLWNRTGLNRAYDHFWHRRKMVIDEAFEDLRKQDSGGWYQPSSMICPIDPEAVQGGLDER